MSGLFDAIFGGGKKDEAPKPPNPPPAPDPNAAEKEAQDKLTASRRALLVSGGETSLTGIGGAPLSNSQTQSRVLLGG